MPCEKELTKLIPKIYKRKAEDLGLFFFVKGQMQIFPKMKIEQGILNYFRFTGITVDEWDVFMAMRTYHRMQKEFYEAAKEVRPGNKA